MTASVETPCPLPVFSFLLILPCKCVSSGCFWAAACGQWVCSLQPITARRIFVKTSRLHGCLPSHECTRSHVSLAEGGVELQSKKAALNKMNHEFWLETHKIWPWICCSLVTNAAPSLHWVSSSLNHHLALSSFGGAIMNVVYRHQLILLSIPFWRGDLYDLS